jgi:uncharacterized membrane protein YkvA (DUF1232 family)
MKRREEYQRILEKAKLLYLEKAARIASCDNKIRKLIERVMLKWQELAASPLFMEARFQIEVFIRMLRAHLNKSYSGLSNRSLALLVLGLFYFALPLDMVPDFIPFVGYVDDLSVLLAIYKSLQADILLFLEWEKARSTAEPR